MKTILITILAIGFSAQSFADEYRCYEKLNKRQDVMCVEKLKKLKVLRDIREMKENPSELSRKELSKIEAILLREDSEVYTPCDSADMGYLITVVEKRSCKILWNGALEYN
jgi:hypothetical protein